MIVRLEPITATTLAVMLGWAWNTSLAPVTVTVDTPQYVWAE